VEPKGAETGTRGEYSTISGNNNVWTNSKEIKDFIKNSNGGVLEETVI
jgi:hypothetical protein